MTSRGIKSDYPEVSNLADSALSYCNVWVLLYIGDFDQISLSVPRTTLLRWKTWSPSAFGNHMMKFQICCKGLTCLRMKEKVPLYN